MEYPSFQLATLPTPIDTLPRISKALGIPTMLLKRDDLTGLALGGNKTRKLEYLIQDALDQKADTVITIGGPQSNHCVQTAAAAAAANLQCHLVLGYRGSPPSEPFSGNLFLDQLFGATCHYVPHEERFEAFDKISNELLAKDQKLYSIPLGGSSGIGSIGYVLAVKELKEQLEEMNETIDLVVFATSSGGTQAGLTLGAKLFDFTPPLLGISVDQTKRGGDIPYAELLAKIANEASPYVKFTGSFSPDDFAINYDYVSDYGVLTADEVKTIQMLAETEGKLLDPVYSGRAFSGMIDLIQKGTIAKDTKILFWHTGGAAALFSHSFSKSGILI